jgi:hypothetical protein
MLPGNGRSHGHLAALLAGVLLLGGSGAGRAQDSLEDLRQKVEQQNKELEQLKRRLDALGLPAAAAPAAPAAVPTGPVVPASAAAPARATEGAAPNGQDEANAPAGDETQAETEDGSDTSSIATAIDNFLKANPGIGMPPSVQTGYSSERGFFVRSAPNPPYVQWQDQSRIPFELRIRGRVQLDYYFYKVTDNLNHLTGARYEPEVGDFSQIEVKRVRIYWEGHAFDPDLRYQLQIDGNTRGLGGTPDNRIVQTAGKATSAASYGAPGIGVDPSTFGGGDVVDHSLRLFTAWVAYDWHLGAGGNGCGPDCPEGTYRYRPTLTLIVGKQQPFFGFTEILGSANSQLVDFAMADWFFDADDNNMLTAAGLQYRDFDDRLFATVQITNGNESQFPNTQMDRWPGFILGFWYDLGGSWDSDVQSWSLYGNSPSDLNFSCRPVLRVGGAANLVPGDRMSIYGDVEQSRVFVTPGGPGGTRLINLLDGAAGTPAGAHALDKFDSYSFDAWASLHYRGFSLTNEWWARRLTGFQTNPLGHDLIVYQDGSGANALFPGGNLLDVGTLVQGGYFLIPKKWEMVGRFSWISGDSGDVNGTGKYRDITVPGIAGPVRDIVGAFRNFHEAREIAVGTNYYFYGQMVKWSTDFSIYRGGNPAAGGASPAGYLAGVDGWMVRTQLQLAF